jgi:fumarate hydratase class II
VTSGLAQWLAALAGKRGVRTIGLVRRAAMHIAAVLELEGLPLPHAEALAAAIEAKANEWNDVVKIGRTHLQDAVPLIVGQEWSGWSRQEGLFELAAGGTAVGTGLNAPPHFSREIAEKIAELTNHPFVTAPNKFAAQGSLDAIVAAMATAPMSQADPWAPGSPQNGWLVARRAA